MKNRTRKPTKSQADLPSRNQQHFKHNRQSSNGTLLYNDMGLTKDINELVALLKRSEEAKKEALSTNQQQHDEQHQTECNQLRKKIAAGKKSLDKEFNEHFVLRSFIATKATKFNAKDAFVDEIKKQRDECNQIGSLLIDSFDQIIPTEESEARQEMQKFREFMIDTMRIT